MAKKKYLSLERLEEYHDLISGVIADGDAGVKSYVNTELAKKANASHDHNDVYYTETEIDTKLSGINSSITNITNGSTPVKEAEHADSADSATSATDASKLGGQLPSYYAKASDIPTGALANKDIVSESDLDTALAEKVNAAAEGNHSHSNKTVLDGITSTKVSAWDSALDSAKEYTNTKTAGMATTTVVDNKISAHNTSSTAHSDIRNLISDLTTKVNNFLDVDDTTTDQLSEVLELIENNKGTLESLTSGKVNVSDIVDNLTTANAKKVLSANQGVALKALIDGLQAEFDSHGHEIADVNGLQSALDGKAASSHGTHVTWSTTSPKMNGTAAVGSETKVARGDHVHPTDTSRASKTEFDTHVADTVKHITATERTNWGTAYTHSQAAHAPSNAQANVIESIKVNGTAQTISSKSVNITVPTKASDIGAATATHGHAISEITNLETTLSNAASAIGANTSSIGAHNDRISALETKVGDGFEEITSADIQNLFK